MIVQEFFEQVNISFRGTDDDVPAAGSADSLMWYRTMNRKINEWATDAKNIWQSNFHYEKPNEPGTVATTATTTLTGTSTYFTDYQIGDTITVSGETVRTIATIVSDTSLTVTVAFSNTGSAKTFTHKTIIVTGVQSYSVHRNLLNPSDVAIVTTTTQDIHYMIGKPQERSRFLNEVYLSGRQPQLLTFYDTISATSNSQLIGATLKLPGYFVPNDLTALTDIIPVDDEYWLVYAVAGELAFNDITYSDKAPDLNAKANNLYSGMVVANRKGTNNYPRQARTNVNRIPGTRSDMGSDSNWNDTL